MTTTLTKADRSHLNRALKAASVSTMKSRHGAVIASGRRVLAVGVNSFRSNPEHVSDPKRQASFHAEVAVLRSLGYSVDGATLYAARINKAGEAAMSYPCSNCREEIRRSGIKQVVFSVEGGFGVYVV